MLYRKIAQNCVVIRRFSTNPHLVTSAIAHFLSSPVAKSTEPRSWARGTSMIKIFLLLLLVLGKGAKWFKRFLQKCWEFVVTRRVFRLVNESKCVFGWGSASNPAGGAHSTQPKSLLSEHLLPCLQRSFK